MLLSAGLSATVVYTNPSPTSTIYVEESPYSGAPSYTIWIEGSTYYAKNAYGHIDYFGTDASQVIQDCIEQLPEGGIIFLRKGYYEISSTIVIPNGTRSLTLMGESGWGKSYLHSGTELCSKVTNGPMLTNDATNDIRSMYALTLKNLKIFAAQEVSDTIGIWIKNLDNLEIASCFISGFGTCLKGTFEGITYPTAEAPGMFFIYDNLWAAAQVEYIYLEKHTQVKIHDNNFESWGPFKRVIRLRDCNRILITANEFDPPLPSSSLSEVIKIEAVAGDEYNPHIIKIAENWAHRPNKNCAFINLTEGTDTEISDVISCNNLIRHDFMPFDENDAIGPYVESRDGIIRADDYLPPLSRTKDGMWHDLKARGFTTKTIYRNLFSPMTVYFYYSIAGENDDIKIYVGYDSGTNFNRVIYDRSWSNSTANSRTINFRVPTHFYWKIEVSSGITLNELFAMYD